MSIQKNSMNKKIEIYKYKSYSFRNNIYLSQNNSLYISNGDLFSSFCNLS